MWIGFVTIKSVAAMTFVGILPKQNVAWERNLRHYNPGVPIKRLATAPYTPAGNPGAMGLHASLTRRRHRLPGRIVALCSVHPRKYRNGAARKTLAMIYKGLGPSHVVMK